MTLITRRTRTWWALFLASLLAFPAISLGGAPTSRRAQAQAAYERALRLRTTLTSRPTDTRLKADYEKVIRAFRSVHWADPAYRKAPVALAAAAELYAEMGRRFSSDYYYHASIKAYEFLIAHYPSAALARDALFTIGEIYRSDLDNPEASRAIFQKFLEKYPRSAKASEAQDKLEQIDRLLAERPRSRPEKPERRRASPVAEVTALRRWVGPNYSRIVINVEGEVKFETSRVPNPDRIVLDLAGTRLSSVLVGKTFPVEDAFLRQIRIGQFQPTVTRVVLDVEKIEEYSVFTLPNPFRLVIDINGPSPKLAEKAPAPKPAKAPVSPPPQATLRAATERPSSARLDSTSAAPEPPEAKVESEAARRDREPETAAETAKPALGRESGEKETASVKVPSLPPLPARKVEPAAPTAGAGAVSIKPAAPTEAGSRTLTRALGLKIARIVIDPGHGGHDTGTIGPTGLTEKHVVQDVAVRLKQLLEKKMGTEVIMTRADDTFVPLEERTAIANEKGADLFISVHTNASRARSARGIETYYLNFTTDPEALEVAARENATSQESVYQLQDLIKKIAMAEKIEESQEFATIVQREIYSRLRRAGGEQRNRGVKKAPFVVLIGANMPSVLAEISFLTNPQDERLLKRPEYRQRIADALYRGITSYVGKLGGVRGTQQASAQESSAASASNF